jgi:DNA-binding Lrp family transcriptional regulator
VLLCIAADPDIRLRDVAHRVGITERSTQRIVADLIADGYLTHEKVGRRNRYRIHGELPLRHPIEKASEVGVLLRLLGAKGLDFSDAAVVLQPEPGAAPLDFASA